MGFRNRLIEFYMLTKFGTKKTFLNFEFFFDLKKENGDFRLEQVERAWNSLSKITKPLFSHFHVKRSKTAF